MFGANLLMVKAERTQFKIHDSAVAAVATAANASQSPASVPLLFISSYVCAPIQYTKPFPFYSSLFTPWFLLANHWHHFVNHCQEPPHGYNLFLISIEWPILLHTSPAPLLLALDYFLPPLLLPTFLCTWKKTSMCDGAIVELLLEAMADDGQNPDYRMEGL